MPKLKNGIYLKNPTGTIMKSVRDLAYLIWKIMYQRAPTFLVERDSVSDQCSSGRSRSIIDMKVIVRTYLPGVTMGDVDKAIKSLYDRPKIGLTHGHCSTVGRIVHEPLNAATTLEQIREALGELNIKKHVRTSRRLSTTNK